MIVPVDDGELLRRQRHFLEQVERKIATVNREILHAQIPELDQASFVRLAEQVARLRAAYLQTALGVAKNGESEAAVVEELRRRREAYDEARLAFEALQRAIERGYVDIGKAAEKVA